MIITNFISLIYRLACVSHYRYRGWLTICTKLAMNNGKWMNLRKKRVKDMNLWLLTIMIN